MIPPAFWEHLNRHERIEYIFWFPSPFYWDSAVSKVHINSLKSLKVWSVITGLVAIILIYSVVFLALGTMSDLFNLNFFQTVIGIGIIDIASFGVLLAIVTLFRNLSICQTVNGITHLSKNPTFQFLVGLDMRGRFTTRIDKRMKHLLNLLYFLVLSGPWAGLLIPFIENSDPLYFLLDKLVHLYLFNNVSIVSVLCEKLLRGLIMSVITVHLLMGVYQYAVFLCMGLNLALKLLSVTFINERSIAMFSRNHKMWLTAREITRALNFHFAYTLYRQVQVISRLHDEMTHLIYPVLFVQMYIAGVLAGFIVCAGYNRVSDLFYLFAIIVSFVVVFAFSIVFPRFCDFDFQSIEFHQYWKKRVVTKVGKARLISLQQVRIGMKPFF